ncbi:hypothetical protein [Sphingomonas sp.]|uniref:hypothetical protein n=1 Tax=Sphingomonas sp. TaxID=28214 RepID=UPI002DD66F0D|nr:hypothetical protein [Sphingomonas sp.]
MFGTSKPQASLSSGLLARKGQARPAMRPQGFHGHAMNLDDLGWNDMGEGAHEPAPVVAIQPAAAPVAPPVATVPPVLVERETLREEIETAPAQEAVAVVVPAAQVARIGREVRAGKAKAAFTLRLDAERHLQLRLASASRNRSAQALVVEALDAFIATLPEIRGLVSQLSDDTASNGRASGGKS